MFRKHFRLSLRFCSKSPDTLARGNWELVLSRQDPESVIIRKTSLLTILCFVLNLLPYLNAEGNSLERSMLPCCFLPRRWVLLDAHCELIREQSRSADYDFMTWSCLKVVKTCLTILEPILCLYCRKVTRGFSHAWNIELSEWSAKIK